MAGREILLISLIITMFLAPCVKATSIMGLLENSDAFDGKIVTVRGEVIGVLVKGDHAWVNILENGYAIGVWCTAEDAEKISVVGDYTHIGDTIEVTGVFHRACPDHGGDLDIHAETLTLISPGHEIPRSLSPFLTALGLILLVTGILVTVFVRVKKREPFHPLGY